MHAWCLKFPRIKIMFVVELRAGICFCYVWFDLWSTFIILSCYLAIFFTAFLISSIHQEQCLRQAISFYFISHSIDRIQMCNSVEITNKMQPCNRICYSTVHWRLNMFRAAYRSSSGALTVFAASGLHTHVVAGRSQVWVGTGKFPLRRDYGQSPHSHVNQRLQIQLELLMMSGMPLETSPPTLYIRMWWPAIVKCEWEMANSHSDLSSAGHHMSM